MEGETVMKRSSRILLAAIVVELLIVLIGAALLFGMASGSLRPATSSADAIQTIMSTLGAAMGVVAGVGGVAWFVARKREG